MTAKEEKRKEPATTELATKPKVPQPTNRLYVWARKRLYRSYTLGRFDLVSKLQAAKRNQVTWTANCATHCSRHWRLPVSR